MLNAWRSGFLKRRPGQHVVHCRHGYPLSNTHAGTHQQERHQTKFGSDGRHSCGNTPPNHSKAQNFLPTKFVSPDTPKHLCQQVTPGQGRTRYSSLSKGSLSFLSIADTIRCTPPSDQTTVVTAKSSSRIQVVLVLRSRESLLYAQGSRNTRRRRTAQCQLCQSPSQIAWTWAAQQCSCSRGPCYRA